MKKLGLLVDPKAEASMISSSVPPPELCLWFAVISQLKAVDAGVPEPMAKKLL